MTRKEKVAQVYPECVGYGHRGGVANCPDDYPFLGTHGLNLTECARKRALNERVDCKECWNTRWKKPELPPRPRKPQWQQDIMNRFMKVI